jgi:hypothetical protein
MRTFPQATRSPSPTSDPRPDGVARLAPRQPSLRAGDDVEWTNDSFVGPTTGSGQVIHISGEHVLVLNGETARRYPHLSPYVSKRAAELRLVRQDLAQETEMQKVA